MRALALWGLAGCASPLPFEPLDGEPYGQDLAAWGAAYWTWAFETPATGHPELDDRSDCGAGQSGDVWFLPSGTGDHARECEVPPNHALVVPIYPVRADTAVRADRTDEDMQASIASWTDDMVGFELAVDGVDYPDPDGFRAGLAPYTIEAPDEDSLYDYFGFEVDGEVHGFSDGWFAILGPPPRGEHELVYAATLINPDNNTNATRQMAVTLIVR